MAIESTTRLVEVNTAYELYSRTINIPEKKDMFIIKEVFNDFRFLSTKVYSKSNMLDLYHTIYLIKTAYYYITFQIILAN